jgi:hypothetical protein
MDSLSVRFSGFHYALCQSRMRVNRPGNVPDRESGFHRKGRLMNKVRSVRTDNVGADELV